jgi:uncharacterized protein (DUF885 family)
MPTRNSQEPGIPGPGPPKQEKTVTRRSFFLRGVQSAALLSISPAIPVPALAEAADKNNEVAESIGADLSSSEMRPLIERFSADHRLLRRYYTIPFAPVTVSRLRALYTTWQQTLGRLDFDALSTDARIDYTLFENFLGYSLRHLDLDEQFQQKVDVYTPFASTIIDLEELRMQMKPVDAKESAAQLASLKQAVDAAQKSLAGQHPDELQREAANRAAGNMQVLGMVLRQWFTFYDGYDPLFTWWAAEPYKEATAALDKYRAFLSEQVVGLKPAEQPAHEGPPEQSTREGAEEAGDSYTNSMANAHPGSINDIIGHAIGRDALLVELAHDMIPYTPEQLLTIANEQFAWCDQEKLKAAQEMGCGDDWKAAAEKVKNDYVPPGEQPALTLKFFDEAVDFVQKHNLITIPPLALETWRRRMIPPQQQLVSPFFLGGEVLQISYPTDTMTYEERIESMRANNIGMSHATVFHEMIPGHELQGFMEQRFRTYRQAFGPTSFYTEGWALYWELLMWDLGFQKTSEERMGALIWRSHRCARIIFSINFHLGRWTPKQCIDLLIDRVGFEPEAAAGEVRRSFGGAYAPLYQAGYLLGGMQLDALRRELVLSGKMSYRDFHDGVLQQNNIPIEMVRAGLTRQSLPRDFHTQWKFHGEVAAAS